MFGVTLANIKKRGEDDTLADEINCVRRDDDSTIVIFFQRTHSKGHPETVYSLKMGVKQAGCLADRINKLLAGE